MIRNVWPLRLGLLACLLMVVGFVGGVGAELSPFRSDGCRLFPEGTLQERQKWCGCCEKHDIDYWQGGTEGQRLVADQALRGCVLESTGNEMLADTMFLGVRGGGHPAFPVWHRWDYAWSYGRGYQSLIEKKKQVSADLARYAQQNPQGFCTT